MSIHEPPVTQITIRRLERRARDDDVAAGQMHRGVVKMEGCVAFPGFSGVLRSTVTAALREQESSSRAPALGSYVDVVHTINTIATIGVKGIDERCQKRA